MRPRVVPATTREPFLSGFVTKSRGSRPTGAESEGVKDVPASCSCPPAASEFGRDGCAKRRCLAGRAGGRTAEVRAFGRVRRTVGGAGRRARALRSVAEAAAVGFASRLGSWSSAAILALVVLRGLGAG